jgi:hypothetical protein
MHVNLKDGHAFVAHMGDRGTSIVDVRDPRSPRLIGRLPAPTPNTHGHKVQIVGDVLLVNRERIPGTQGPWTAGMDIYDVSRVQAPRHIGSWSCGGKGVHRMTYWQYPLAYVTAGDDGFSDQFLVILDLSDPTSPREVGRWWLPGMHLAAGEEPTWPADRSVKLHHAIVRDDRAFCAWWDEGLVILDVADASAPRLLGRLRFGDDVSRHTHTTCPLPGRDLLVVTEERIVAGCDGIAPNVRLVDIGAIEAPQTVSTFPVPEGDFCSRGGRFGPHNVHEPRPGSLADGRTVYLTYFSAGLRVYDVTDAFMPTEIAYYVPDPPTGQPVIQFNDVLVADEGLIYATDRVAGGLYILELDGAAAAARRPVDDS